MSAHVGMPAECVPTGAPADSDEALLRAVAAGDHAAFSALVHTYSKLCYRVAWRQLQSREDAEEVTQEIFLMLWSEPWRWRPGGAPFKAWLLRVLANRCTDRWRAGVRRNSAAPGLERPVAVPGPEARLLWTEEQQRLRNVLSCLPVQYRLAVNLYYYEGLPQEEVAVVLGRSLRAVESLLRRARLRLRDLLEEKP